MCCGARGVEAVRTGIAAAQPFEPAAAGRSRPRRQTRPAETSGDEIEAALSELVARAAADPSAPFEREALRALAAARQGRPAGLSADHRPAEAGRRPHAGSRARAAARELAGDRGRTGDRSNRPCGRGRTLLRDPRRHDRLAQGDPRGRGTVSRSATSRRGSSPRRCSTTAPSSAPSS